MTNDKIKLGVLWKHLSRQGNKPYLSGRVDEENLDAAVQLLRSGGRFLVLSSKKRPDKQDPDCEIFVVPEPESRQQDAAARPPAQRQGPPTSPQSRPTNQASRPRR